MPISRNGRSRVERPDPVRSPRSAQTATTFPHSPGPTLPLCFRVAGGGAARLPPLRARAAPPALETLKRWEMPRAVDVVGGRASKSAKVPARCNDRDSCVAEARRPVGRVHGIGSLCIRQESPAIAFLRSADRQDVLAASEGCERQICYWGLPYKVAGGSPPLKWLGRPKSLFPPEHGFTRIWRPLSL